MRLYIQNKLLSDESSCRIKQIKVSDMINYLFLAVLRLAFRTRRLISATEGFALSGLRSAMRHIGSCICLSKIVSPLWEKINRDPRDNSLLEIAGSFIVRVLRSISTVSIDGSFQPVSVEYTNWKSANKTQHF
jgi:hypothetical protein